MTLTVISYGGGVQSTAMIVLAAQGRLGYDVTDALFANVGDDSEHPSTLRYVRDVMTPWAADRGITVHELHPIKRDGTVETLWQQLMQPNSRSIPIPVRMPNGAPGTRSCTKNFKIVVVGKWLKAHGASKDNPATVCIGISTDEVERIGNKHVKPYEQTVYPLIELGLDRSNCQQIIAEVGLPVPPKSSCFFCPFHRPQTWAEMRRDEPQLFARSQQLEDTLNERRARLTCAGSGQRKSVVVGWAECPADHNDSGDICGECDDTGEVAVVEEVRNAFAACPVCKTDRWYDALGVCEPHQMAPVWLTRFNKRLSDAVAEAQAPLFTDGHFNDGGCDEGYCWT